MDWKQLALVTGIALLSRANVEAVDYRVTFDATWSSVSHPDAYPPGAHFSTPIGTTHNDSVQFWMPGELATPGIEAVAETGSVSLLREEISSAIEGGSAFGYVQGVGFGSPGVSQFSFEAIEEFPLVSIVSMIAPSPDWFVGVHSLSLRDETGWLDQMVVPLLPFDAGTESGNTMSLSNPPTNPPEPIRRLDTKMSSLLFQSNPFGTLTFDRLAECDLNGDDRCNTADLSSDSGLYSVGDLTKGVPVVSGQNSRFDLNHDGWLDENDLDLWLAMAAEHNGFAEPYLRGDTNLNDHVGFGDFTGLSRGFGVGREWTEGNYDGSTNTDFVDFLALSGNFGKQIRRQNQAATVPEPSSGLCTFLCMAILSWIRPRPVLAV